MNILDTIIEHKIGEIGLRKKQVTISEMEKHPHFSRETFSLKKFLLDENRNGIIAEFKRKSPSKGIINAAADVKTITQAYTHYGASGLSVLTDELFFGGHAKDLEQARENVIPILRKDFIIDAYQVIEAKAMGADIILLIAACLTPAAVKELAIFAHRLGLEVLLEIHNKEETGHICEEIDLVGVNNRDLKSFNVDVNRSIALSEWIPETKIKIAESGIHDVQTIQRLKEHGFKGFLIGESFMNKADPAIAFASFVNQLKNAQHEDKSLRHDSARPGQKTG